MRMPKERRDKPWSPDPSPSRHAHPALVRAPRVPTRLETLVREILDPVLVPLGFGRGQVGMDADRGQVVFCRGEIDSPDGGCVDLVLDVEAVPDWRITDVRYWGFPSDRWRLDFDRAARLADQLRGLARNLPSELG